MNILLQNQVSFVVMFPQTYFHWVSWIHTSVNVHVQFDLYTALISSGTMQTPYQIANECAASFLPLLNPTHKMHSTPYPHSRSQIMVLWSQTPNNQEPSTPSQLYFAVSSPKCRAKSWRQMFRKCGTVQNLGTITNQNLIQGEIKEIELR
jgi:hypothetical protein